MILEKEGGLAQTEFLERDRKGYCLSCLDAVRSLQETGRFGEAQNELEDALRDSENWREMAMACLLLGELFNKWGAASPTYTIAIMEKGAIYANRAVQLWEIARKERLFDDNPEDMGHLLISLYWKALNLASVAGLGGCERWSVKGALQQASEASEQMVQTADRTLAAFDVQARKDFVDGIIIFCRAKALENNQINIADFPDSKHHNTDEEVKFLRYQCLQLFIDAQQVFAGGEQTMCDQNIKATTMIAVTYKLLGETEKAIDWSEKEVEGRLRLHGEWNPRTQLAKRNLALLKGLTNEDEKEIESCKLFSFKTAQMIKPEEITWSLDPFMLSSSWRMNCLLRIFLLTGVVNEFQIEEDKLLNFLQKVRRSYHDENPFHNWYHAWSVTHCAFMLMRETAIGKILGMKEKLSVLIACLTHDLSHPGVNSDFLIKSASPIALQFPFSNVLEQMHWNEASSLFEEGRDTNFLSHLEESERDEILEMVHGGIMATDMQIHKQIVSSLSSRRDKLSEVNVDPSLSQDRAMTVYDATSPADRLELFKAVVHCADLSGQAMDAPVAYSFGKAVLEEFHQQAKRERMENLQESAFMKDLHEPLAQAKTQLGFLHYVVGPLWKCMADLFPQVTSQYERIEERSREIDFEHLECWQGRHDGLRD